MDQSTSTITNTISKGTEIDTSFEVDPGTPGWPPERPYSISNEQIGKGDLILETYQVMSEPIHGGMGSVWRVHHTSWDVDLAMKRPQPRFFAEGSERRKELFIRECENWIGLGLHPNIVSCYYVRETGGVPTVFSEWMEHGSLKDRIRDESLYSGPEAEAQERILDIAIQTARGLRYSHGNNLIHQDVKPGNLLLTKQWDVKVGDFGLARAHSQMEEESESNGRSAAYTLSYCPEEQVKGMKPERWMDIYAWAVTVLEMYAGNRPWKTGAEAKEMFFEVCRQCRIGIPERLAVLLKNALDRQYDSFDDLMPSLEEIYREETGSTYPRPDDRNASDTAGILNNRALSYLDLGMPDRALETWESAINLSPEHQDSIFNRELYLLRTSRETDREVLETLSRYDPSGELREQIRRECGGIYSGYDQDAEDGWREVKISGSASYEAHSGGYLYLPVFEPPAEELKYLDPRDHGHSQLIGLKKVKLDGTQEELLDPMKGLAPLLPRGRREIVIHPGTMIAALLQYHVLSLYDIASGKLLVNQKTVLEGDTSSSLLFSPDGTRIVLDVTLGRREKKYYTVVLRVPDLEAVLEAEYKFVGFSEEGIYLRSKERLAHFTEKEGIRTLFAFGEDEVETAYEHTGENAPFFSYRCRSGEAFYLDEEFHKVPLTDLCFEGDKTILHYDPQKKLLIRKLSGTGIALWDLAEQRRLCTFATPNQFIPIWDAEDQVLIFTSTMNNYTRWETTPLPKRRTDVRNAAWRISGITTSASRIEEDRRIEALAEEFRRFKEKGDLTGQIRTHRRATEIEGFPTSRYSGEMEAWLDQHARRCAIYGAFPGEKMWELPLLSGEHFEVTPLSDGSFAMTEEYIGESGGVALFHEDGSLVRFVRIEGSCYGDKPFFLTRVVVRRDRIYAFTGKLEYAVYDLEGNRIAVSVKEWPPVKKKKEREEEFNYYDEEEWERARRERKQEVSYNFLDMDSSGRYLLYSQYDGNQGGISGTFQKDLVTGDILKISDRFSTVFTFGRYLEDDTIIFLQKGGVLERFTKEGTSLNRWPVGVTGYDAIKMRLSLKRDRILIFVEKEKAPGKTFIYGTDGTLLYHWDETQYVCQMFMDGRFIYEPRFQIRDGRTGEVAYKAPIPFVTGGIKISPDGRKVYVREYDTTQREGKGIATEYTIKYLYEEIPEDEIETPWHFPSPDEIPDDFSYLESPESGAYDGTGKEAYGGTGKGADDGTGKGADGGTGKGADGGMRDGRDDSAQPEEGRNAPALKSKTVRKGPAEETGPKEKQGLLRNLGNRFSRLFRG